MRINHLREPLVANPIGMKPVFFSIAKIRRVRIAKRHETSLGIQINYRHAPNIADFLYAIDVCIKISPALVRPILRRLDIGRRTLKKCAVNWR